MGDLHYLSAFPELEVADLDASARWYERVLGFRRIATYTLAGGRTLHLRRSEDQDLVLREARWEPRSTHCFATDSDLPRGGEGRRIPDHGPDEPEALEYTDPDGHVLRFFARQVPRPIR